MCIPLTTITWTTLQDIGRGLHTRQMECHSEAQSAEKTRGCAGSHSYETFPPHKPPRTSAVLSVLCGKKQPFPIHTPFRQKNMNRHPSHVQYPVTTFIRTTLQKQGGLNPSNFFPRPGLAALPRATCSLANYKARLHRNLLLNRSM
jgi:hypothetical protein